jgi:hypothetical protein
MSDNEQKEVIEQPILNKEPEKINEDLSQEIIKEQGDEKPSKIEMKQNEILSEKKIKVDRRKITSKLNAQKAREAKLKKLKEQKEKLKQLFDSSSSSESETDDDTDDSASESDDDLRKYHQYKYKSVINKQQKEINDLKSMIFRIAEKQKKNKLKRKSKRKKNKTKSPQQQPQPINIYTTSQPIDIPKPEKKSSSFKDFLKERLQK